VSVRKLISIVLGATLAMIWSGSITRKPQVSSLPIVADPTHSSSTHSSLVQGSSSDADCKDDCRGHDAGYYWAEAHFVRDKRDCDFAGEHSTFTAGCRDYVNRQKSASSQSSYRRPSDEENDTPDSDSDDQ
jgi:hypothetical protein